MKHILLLLLLILLSQPAFGDTYKWIDEKGNVHFTDDIQQVPVKYRSQIEKIGLPEGRDETKRETESPPTKKEAPHKDRLGRGEEYWRASIEEWKGKLTTAQGKLESLRVRYNELTGKINDSMNSVQRSTLRKEREQLKAEMDLCKSQIDEAKNMLEKKIPEEAEFYKAKPEWVKQ